MDPSFRWENDIINVRNWPFAVLISFRQMGRKRLEAVIQRR